MPKLNLIAETSEQEHIKAYLESTASETLAEKINNGIKIEKDGQTLTNKKDLGGFMKFACDKAKKFTEKGSTSACVEDSVVYGWALHYFEEDSIEGKLLNEDGTEYTPAPKQTQRNPAPDVSPVLNVSKKKSPQISFFDTIPEEKPETEVRPVPVPVKSEIPLQASPLYQRYLSLQQKYPDSVIAWRLGDFYEVFGINAVKISESLDLTLTGRDCGLPERVPMVGFPYHAAEIYFSKLIGKGFTLAVAENLNTVRLLPEKEIDEETGEILTEEEMREFDGDISEPKELSNESDELDEERERLKVFDKDALCVILELFDAKIILF